MRSNLLFYKFETKAKPGKLIAYGIRFETLELEVAKGVDQTKFKILCEDHEDEFRGVDLASFKAAVAQNFPSH